MRIRPCAWPLNRAGLPFTEYRSLAWKPTGARMCALAVRRLWRLLRSGGDGYRCICAGHGSLRSL